MSEDLVNLEINGRACQARKGAMLIEVTDAEDIRVPRFCYHKKLSVAANCRMCMVEVEKAPKPLPACATPVMEGMKVFTHSPLAIDAQKGTMEFLLINHPLDCPVCDQGGECELQDIAMGYGEDVSRYTEKKRVVKDMNLGPLISTDMTRCIHCTRCVRFGTEIAGLMEMGATGRGEYMRIGTYIEQSVDSEMSGNMIDICPVGALNAKPSRMEARAWEMIQHATISPHDCMGSNLYMHTLRGRVIRAVPRENETINETWLPDRDRFSYQGLTSEDRLMQPMIKRNDHWETVDWEMALEFVVEKLRTYPAGDVGALIAPNSSVEEMYLFQKWLRGIGVHNIDHRLRQTDFRDQHSAPLFPWLGQSIAELESMDALLLIGSNVRKEQPIAAHRIRKASLKGASISVINPRDFGFRFAVASQMITEPYSLVKSLSAVTRAALSIRPVEVPAAVTRLLKDVEPDETAQSIARQLLESKNGSVLLGNIASQHPDYSLLRALAFVLADISNTRLGYLTEAANSAGAWLTGAVPHRLAGGGKDRHAGLNAGAMLQSGRKTFLLYGVEPELDCDDPAASLNALNEAEFVVSFTPFASKTMRHYADVLLPITTSAEMFGTFVNAEGRWQSFEGVTLPPGEARPGWKLLRVLGNQFHVDGFDYMAPNAVLGEVKGLFDVNAAFNNHLKFSESLPPAQSAAGLVRAGSVPIYASDSLVRRADALQHTADARTSAVILNPRQAELLGLEGVSHVIVNQGFSDVHLALEIDDAVPEGCVWVPAGVLETRSLGSTFGPITLRRAGE